MVVGWEEHEAASGDGGWACSFGAAVLPKPSAHTRKDRKKDEISTTVRREEGTVVVVVGLWEGGHPYIDACRRRGGWRGGGRAGFISVGVPPPAPPPLLFNLSRKIIIAPKFVCSGGDVAYRRVCSLFASLVRSGGSLVSCAFSFFRRGCLCTCEVEFCTGAVECRGARPRPGGF